MINNVLVDSGMKLEDIVECLSGEGLSMIEKEKNEGEVGRSTVDDSGTVTYTKLL
jgi:hypothetical protein